MADKRIQDLTPATSVQTNDLFVLEQNGAAKSLSGQILINDLATALSGHGGIASITYTAPVAPSLDGTLTITMADTTTSTVTVTNGNGIDTIGVEYGISNDGTDPAYVQSWNNTPVAPTDQYPYGWTKIAITDITGNTTNAYSITVKADDPTISIGTVAAASGTPAAASITNSGTAHDPVLNFSFTLPQGDKGDTGDYIEPIVSYGTSQAAATEPGTWYNDPSSISYAAGNYIWRKTEYTLHDAQTVQDTVKEIVGYIGQNGSGSGTVTQITFNGSVFADDGTGNVNMTIDASDVGAIEDPSTKSNGQVLTYDSSAGEWVAANPSTGNVNTVNSKGVDAGTTNITLYASDIKMSSLDNTTIPNAIPSASSTTPADLGTAAVGTGTTWARADHVHKMPSYGECLEEPTGTYDLNSFTNPGLFFFSGASTLSNQPSGNAAGWLCVLVAGTVTKQLWYRSSVGGVSDTYQRLCDSGTWTSWVRFVTETDSPDEGSYEPSAVTIASSTSTNVLSKQFSPGTYVFVGTAQYAANATGRRNTWFTDGGNFETVEVPAVNGDPTKIQITGIRKFTTNTTVSLRCWQNSGSSLSVQGALKWVRVH